MKTQFNRVLSVICILSMLLSCVPFIGAQAADELSIITAQFVPYEQKIRILAKFPGDYSAKMYVADSEVACEKVVTSDGTLFTSSGFVPSAYGIVPVKLEATNGINTLSDTQNIRIVKAFSKAESLSENFNNLDAMTMSDASDSTIVDAVKANNSMLSISGVPNTTNIRKYVDITKDYTQDGSSALAMRFESTVASGLPSLRLNPSTDGTNGIIELSYDLMTNNTEIRQTIYPISRAYNSKYTFITNDGTSFASSFQAVHYSTHCFGSTKKKIEINKWYNIRFLMNLNDLTFEYYVNDELINYGTFTYQSTSYTENYIYGINYFDLAAGTQGTAGASEENSAYVVFDNMNITHVNTGASPASLSYSLSGKETDVEILNAEIPFNSESIKLCLNSDITYAEGDITLKKIDGTDVDVSVAYCEGIPYASEKYRSCFIITPDNPLEIGEKYKISISSDVKFGSNKYDVPTEVYFKSVGLFTVLSPNNTHSVNVGEKVELKACTPDAVAVDLYINDMFISTLIPDQNACVSYLYDTASSSLGTNFVRFVSINSDNTVDTLDTEFSIVNNMDKDVVSLKTFDSSADSSAFLLTKQASANTVSLSMENVDNKTALAAYYNAKSSTGKAVELSTIISDDVIDGRIVLEHDFYVSDARAGIQFGFYNGTYTVYPLDPTNRRQFYRGSIGNEAMSYSGWHKVKFIIDTINQTSEMYFDDNKIEQMNDYWSLNYKADYVGKTDGYKKVTITYWQESSVTASSDVLAFAIDNWHIYKEMPLPVVSDVTSFDSLANSAALEQGELVMSNTRSFKIDVPNAIYTNSASFVQNFKVTVDGKQLGVENVVLSDGTLTFDVVSLPENVDLDFVIGKDTLMYDGLTTIGSDVVFSLKVADDNGVYSKRSINIVGDKAKAVFKTDAFDDTSVVLIIATYNDDILTGITTKPVKAAEAEITTLALPISGSTHAKAFIWGDLSSVYPISAGEVKADLN